MFVFNKDSFTFFDLLNDYLFEIEKFIVPNLLSAKVLISTWVKQKLCTLGDITKVYNIDVSIKLLYFDMSLDF